MMSMLGERSSRAQAEATYKEAQALEAQLRPLLRAKGFSDPTAVSLSNALREKLEAVLLLDHEFAESHEVEQAIWRGVYRRIEDYRSRLRKVSAQGARGAGPAGARVAGKAGSKDSTQNVLVSFRSYLAEATGLYHDLLRKLRSKYGAPQLSLLETSLQCGVPNTRMGQVSCHRCLIYLGDLARYREVHSDAKQKEKDWASPAGYYLQAAGVYPASGNPHNQLAVLATYVEDELLAVYRYFRSLACELPFLTARDNLIILFEKNRKHYVEASARFEEGGVASLAALAPARVAGAVVNVERDVLLSTGDTGMKLAVKKKSVGLSDKELALVGHRYLARLALVRTAGIIFTKTSLETFDAVLAVALRELGELVASDSELVLGAADPEQRGNVGAVAAALQIAVVVVFTVENCGWAGEGPAPSFAEVRMRESVVRQAYRAALEVGTCLLRHLAQGPAAERSGLLPPALLLLEWLAAQPDAAAGNADKGDAQEQARAAFWKAAAGLLNALVPVAGLPGECCLLPSFPLVGPALWEDYELRGFQPLARAHSQLDFSAPEPLPGLGPPPQQRQRVLRALAAGRAIAECLAGMGTEGLRWVEARAQFYGTERETLLLPPLSPALQLGAELAQKVSLGGEEEEEVIVFQPPPAAPPVPLRPPLLAVARTPEDASLDAEAEDLLRAAALPQAAEEQGWDTDGPHKLPADHPWRLEASTPGEKVLQPWKPPSELGAGEAANSLLFEALEPEGAEDGGTIGAGPPYQTMMQNTLTAAAPARSSGEASLAAWNLPKGPPTAPLQGPPKVPTFEEYQAEFARRRHAAVAVTTRVPSASAPRPWPSADPCSSSLFANGAPPIPPPGVIGERRSSTPSPSPTGPGPEPRWGLPDHRMPSPPSPPFLDGGLPIPNPEEYAASPAFAAALRDLIEHKDEYSEPGAGSLLWGADGQANAPRGADGKVLSSAQPTRALHPAHQDHQLLQRMGDLSWLDALTHTAPPGYKQDPLRGAGGGGFMGQVPAGAGAGSSQQAWQRALSPGPFAFPFPGTSAAVQATQAGGRGPEQQRRSTHTNNPFVP